MPDEKDPLQWLRLPQINNAEIARSMDMTPSKFKLKRDNQQYRKFNDAELERLTQIKQELITLLQD